jgi:nitroimidazol reductase NimA-like FMN-containing flavoprotein (pyridoxamine 5'-phosphate oxidase superfamily)
MPPGAHALETRADHVPRHARHRVDRTKARAHYDRPTVHAILDAGMVAHVGFCVDGQPFVIPMMYARDGDALVLHGSVASRLMGELGTGIAACVSVTHVDGLVLARSHFDHSMNYRSVVAFGRARLLDDPAAKADALARFVDAIVPGRAAESRSPDRTELAATSVLHFEIEDASAKIRSGGMKGNAADLALPYWAGVIPQHFVCGVVEPDETVAAGTPLPASVTALLAAKGRSP